MSCRLYRIFCVLGGCFIRPTVEARNVSVLSEDLNNRLYWWNRDSNAEDGPNFTGTLYMIPFGALRICVDINATYLWVNCRSSTGWSGWKKVTLTQ